MEVGPADQPSLRHIGEHGSAGLVVSLLKVVSRGKRPGNTETDLEVADTGVVLTAVCRAQEPRHVTPGAATQHAPLAFSGLPSLAIRWGTRIPVIPAVLRPLPYVAMNFMETKGIRRKRTHLYRLSPIPAFLPGTIGVAAIIVRLVGGNRRARVKWTRRSCSRHILPTLIRSTTDSSFLSVVTATSHTLERHPN